MPDFVKPDFPYTVDLAGELHRLRSHRETRLIPTRKTGRLLAATWNVANFGTQEREPEHLELIAEIISWFDLVALQEVKDNFADLYRVLLLLGQNAWRVIFTDKAGNQERMAYLYRWRKLELLEKIGELAIPPAEHRYIRLPSTEQSFEGFDRNPYLATFHTGDTTFLFLNVHLYFGTDSAISRNRRSLETYAVGRWADLRRESPYAFTREIVALGDFNMPMAAPGDPIYDALTARGLEVPDHSSEMGSTLANDTHYDQVAFFPGPTKDRYRTQGVFDFDTVIFPDLWSGRGKTDFDTYVRYYMSDHRPVWFELDTTK